MSVAMTEKPKHATPLQILKAVLWSFMGIRRKAEHEADAVRLKPVQVILAGLAAALIFVLTLVLFVRFVIHSVT